MSAKRLTALVAAFFFGLPTAFVTVSALSVPVMQVVSAKAALAKPAGAQTPANSGQSAGQTSSEDPAGFLASVKQCIDGDTLTLHTGQKIRFAGVDTPEKGSRETPPQYYANEAHAFTCAKVRGQQIRIVPVAGDTKAAEDRYHRLVAEVLLPDGRSLNEWLLREGLASFYAHKNLPAQLVERLLAAQKEALDKRAGCWAALLERPQAKEAFVGNRNSKRFFSLTCPQASDIAKRNRVSFKDMEAAFRAGYAPARPCNLWPLARDVAR